MIEVISRRLVLPGCLPPFTQEEVKREPMLFNCSAEAARRLGGPITRAFLDRLPPDYGDPVVIDTRVHMLMPGWYPCIPGWHHDDVPRTRIDGQPNYQLDQDRSEHVTALVGADVARSKFALGHGFFRDVPIGSVVYDAWHREVVGKLRSGDLTGWRAPMGRLVLFDDRTWHRGVAARGNGWRWFGRASRYKDHSGARIDRRNPRTNEVRSQVQIYMARANAGW
jgi:hypothetical protein